MSQTPEWLANVDRQARRLRNRFGPRWVIGVSGGSDSVGLLRTLHRVAPRLGLTLSVAHLDHGTRGEAGRDDGQFVAGLAESLGLPFDLGGWSPERPAHFEADARRARYAWLVEIARSRGASVVAVGHTRDDQAETILHRIVRGTGPRGLAGIPKARPLDDGVTLVRPLLAVGHDDIRGFLTDLGQPWRDDASNLDTTRTRSRIRHDLLPEIARAFNPAIVDALTRLARLTRAAVDSLDHHVAAILREAIRPSSPGDFAIDRQALASHPPFLRAEVLRVLWRTAGWPEAGMDTARWRRLAAHVVGPEGIHDAGAGVRLAVEVDLVKLSRRMDLPVNLPPLSVALELPGQVDWLGGRIEATIMTAVDRLPAPSTEWIDLDRLTPPLRIEPPRDGDRFDPLGLLGKTTPLADFFRGRHVARPDRHLIPIVKDATGIIWVVGHRIAHRVRMTEGTQRVVRLRWVAADEGQL